MQWFIKKDISSNIKPFMGVTINYTNTWNTVYSKVFLNGYYDDGLCHL